MMTCPITILYSNAHARTPVCGLSVGLPAPPLSMYTCMVWPLSQISVVCMSVCMFVCWQVWAFNCHFCWQLWDFIGSSAFSLTLILWVSIDSDGFSMSFICDYRFSLAIMSFHWRLWVFDGDAGFLLTIIGFH